MKASRKTPTLQGSVNIICRAVDAGVFTPGATGMMIAFVAEQFGRSQDDIQWRVDATLEAGFHRDGIHAVL